MLPDLEGRARRRRYVLLVLGVSLLLVVAAALAPEGFGWFGGSEPGGSDRDAVVVDLPVLFQYLLVAIAAVALAIYVLARTSAMKEYRVPERRPMWPMVISAFLFLLLLAFSGELREFLGDLLPGRPDGSSGEAERLPGSENRPDTRATLLGWVLTAALAIVFARLLIGGYILFHRDAAARRASSEQEMLLEEIDAGLEDLTRISDPRAAVIACYARLQAFAGRAGVERRASDTPFELLERCLERYELAEPSARRLTDLFERAKFSTARIDESARRDALAALRDVRDRIGAPA